ncbi:peptidase U32 [Desulfuromonas versatilis]|uniref:Peptidase U32 n=1 Tax=Desulfuromonas versatilis TaxID=2802975 RepID=A0ABM8HNZ1_9BACT|nr:peptidase U32 family protein [Desulfuromonas versatilis]BCR03309.1 peptidase U32 [Desulfuromonas versatilis]
MKPSAPLEKPELLSPAGSLEAFFAAMESGADAVYVGLKDFSARAKAKNFTLGELERMLNFAHGRGRKIYVTLNTLVKEAELPLLTETLAGLEAIGADGVILQDLAVWRLAREHFPGLELHASTQMTVHNAAGVKMLERMGFTRAVLARELSLAEIAAIRKQTTLELEHFIHGALCFSFSGQCYFSSFLGGKSGNRGRCAQPCRRRYRYRQQDGYYFSTNDLSAIDLLPELAEAGVISLKIEGRMKSAEYVANVVGAYRMALDSPPAKRQEAVREAKELLKASFGRLPTKGFLTGPNPTDIAIPSLKGATGRFLGEVTQVRGGTVWFKTRDRLHVGDRLRIQPKSDQAGTAFTVKELRLGKRTAKLAQAGMLVSVPSPFNDKFQVGDAVFKVSSEQAFTMSEAACRRKLEAAAPAPTPLRLHIALTDGRLRLRAEARGVTIERDYPVETYPAEENPLSAQTLHEAFAKTAGEPLLLELLETGELPPVVIPPSRLKQVRREFYRELAGALQSGSRELRSRRLQAAREALLPFVQPRPAEGREISVAIRDLRDLALLNDPAVDRLFLPLTPGNLNNLGKAARRSPEQKERIFWELPFILFDEQWEDYRGAIRHLVEQGFRCFRLNNLGHFELFDGLEGVRLATSYRLFSLNSQAVLAWKQLGAAEAGLYIEDDRENLRELLARDAGVDLNMPVYGSVPLITSRIPVRGVRSDQPVRSDRGDGYRVDGRSGLTVISAENDFSLLGHLAELQSLGCRCFTLDLSHVGPFSPQGKKVLEALKKGQEVPGTSPFNFLMGME